MKKIYFFLIALWSNQIFSQINISKAADFGVNGVVEIPYLPSMKDINFQELYLNDDNSIYLCLGTEGTSHAGLIEKFTDRGSPDLSYNNSGKIEMEGNLYTAFEFKKQQNKILAIYVNDYMDDNPDSKMIRFNENGTRDLSFGTNGVLPAQNLPFQQKFFLSSDNSIFHLNSKLYKYNSNGTADTGFGAAGVSDTFSFGKELNGELFNFIKDKNGINYFHLNYQLIISSKENNPNQFSIYTLPDVLSSYYEFKEGSANPMIECLKMDITDAGKMGYLFDIQNPYRSNDVGHRFVILNDQMQPERFNGKDYLDLQNSSAVSFMKDFAAYNDSFIFAGTKNNLPVISVYQNNGTAVPVNNDADYSENIALNTFSKIYVKDNFLYAVGVNETANKAFIVKYVLSKASNSNANNSTATGKINFVNPIGDHLEIFNLKNQKDIEIFSLDGRKLITSEVAQINTSTLSPGNYLVKINFINGESKTFKGTKK